MGVGSAKQVGFKPGVKERGSMSRVVNQKRKKYIRANCLRSLFIPETIKRRLNIVTVDGTLTEVIKLMTYLIPPLASHHVTDALVIGCSCHCPAAGLRNIAICVSVCLYVCPLAYPVSTWMSSPPRRPAVTLTFDF